jgi:hypothetical protein
MIAEGFQKHLNFDYAFIKNMANAAMRPDTHFMTFGVADSNTTDSTGVLKISDLSKHNRIEHDASLTRLDHPNPQIPDPGLIQDIIKRSKDGKKLTIKDVAKLRVDRYNACQKKKSKDGKGNGNCHFGLKQTFLSWGEAAFMISTLGDDEGNVPLDFFKEFMGEEKFPKGWKKPEKPVGRGKVAPLVFKMLSMVGIFGGGELKDEL